MYRCTFMHIQGLSKFLDKGDKSTVDASWVRPECLFLFNKETCPLVQQEYRCQFGQENTSSSSTTRHVFWLNEQTRPLVDQEDMSSCSTRRHVFLLSRGTCLLVELNKKTCLLAQCRKTDLPVQQEYISRWQEYMSSC